MCDNIQSTTIMSYQKLIVEITLSNISIFFSFKLYLIITSIFFLHNKVISQNN